MSGDKDQSEKTEEPTLHRIEESRKKGQVANSKELTSVLVLAASVLTLGLSVIYIFDILQEYMRWLASQDFDKVFEEVKFKALVSRSAVTLLKAAAPVCLISLFVGVISNVAQFGFLYSPEVLELKFERVNPLSGFKRIFSMKSIAEVVKGLFKFSIILGIVYSFLSDHIHDYNGFFHVNFDQAFLHGKGLILQLGFSIIGGLILIALGDLAWERYSHKKQLMMTKEEVKQESKERDGSPEVKQKIKSIQREMSQKRMFNDIPKADVIVTNPTHISIALKYDPETMIAPEVVAKGADNVAKRIREIAKEHDIPIVENIPLARGIYKTVKIGEGVPKALYKAIAEVLAFVYKLKRKKKALS